MKAIAANLFGKKRAGNLPQVGDGEALMRQPSLRAAKHGEVLDGLGVAILEAAVGEPAPVELPAPPDRLQGIRSGPAALLHLPQGVA